MTPLGAALHVAGGAPELVDATRANNILLITDGMENCGGSPVGEVRSIFGRDIKTYVVGFGSEVDRNMLSQMATVGGTARAGTQKYYQADDPAELARAMTAIAQGAAGCDVKLAKTPPDPSKIYVYVNGVQQPADPNRVNGWSYQASTDRVTLYGASCEKVSQNPGAKINIVYGCPDDSFVEGGNGSPCASNGQCASNRCVNGTCQGGAGGPGGSPCTAPNDCQSLACTNGVCEGPKPDGTPCTQNTQCLSGQCLSGGVCGSDIN
jgi:hypothetical protein